MKVQVEEITSRKFHQELEAASVTISPTGFFQEDVEFPEGTLTMSDKNAFGRNRTFYLLPDYKMLVEMVDGPLGKNLARVNDEARVQQVLKANGK